MWLNRKFLLSFLSKTRKSPISRTRNFTISTDYRESSEPETFREALTIIDNLAIIPRESNDPNNLKETWKFLHRSGITPHDLDTLSAIHVAGTKGKSSACAVCESILRSYDCKTGFFSSPHFVSITERFQINGRPISDKYFTKIFWKVYNTLERYKENASDMPTFFKFMTILGFHIFFDSNVDVAIVETGIGGMYDCTNVLRTTQTIGLTTISSDHESILGRNLEHIAMHKAGIIKQHANVFAVPMQDNIFGILEEAAHEKQANLYVVPDISEYHFKKLPAKIRLGDQIQNLNSSLGIQLAYNWLRKSRQAQSNPALLRTGIVLDTSSEIVKGIDRCSWPGICQTVHVGNKTFYMNGAETLPNLAQCVDWFRKLTDFGSTYRCLLFNAAPNTNIRNTLYTIANSVNFQTVLFVPDIHYTLADPIFESERTLKSGADQVEMAEKCARYWSRLHRESNSTRVKHFTAILDAILYLDKFYPDIEFDILVTGSMSVIGATRKALERYRILSG